MRVEIRRAGERYTGQGEGVVSRHAFSFSGHYDPANVHFGPLLACNEERLDPGAGFAEHRHRDTEIVTWVLEGALAHRDSEGNAGVVPPGTVQRMSAGAGVLHVERNAGDEPVRFLQMWLQPDSFGGEPSYDQAVIDPAARHTVLASGTGLPHPGAPVRLRRSDAALHLLRSGPTTRPLRGLPVAPYLYLHVVRGELHFQADTVAAGGGSGDAGGSGAASAVHVLREGDAARVRDSSEWLWPAVGPDGVEVLAWEAHSDLRYG